MLTILLFTVVCPPLSPNCWAQANDCLALDRPQQLVAATLVHQGLGTGPRQRHGLEISLAALLPKVSVRVGESDGLGNFFNITGAGADRQDQSNYVARRWHVAAAWDFSRIVFDKSNLALDGADRQHHQMRRRLVEEVLGLAKKLVANAAAREADPSDPATRAERWYLRARITALSGRRLCSRQVRAKVRGDDRFRTTQSTTIPRRDAY